MSRLTELEDPTSGGDSFGGAERSAIDANIRPRLFLAIWFPFGLAIERGSNKPYAEELEFSFDFAATLAVRIFKCARFDLIEGHKLLNGLISCTGLALNFC